MELSNNNKEKSVLPFNNLYLNSGLVNGFNKGWMYLTTILLLIIGYLLFQSIIFYPLINILKQNGFSETEILSNAHLLFNSEALKLDKNWVILIELGMFVFAFIGFFIGLKKIHNKSLNSVLTGFQKFRINRVGFAFLIWGLLLLFSVIINYIKNPADFTFQFNLQGFIISTVILLLFMPIQTGIEELFFRGYLIQGLSQIFKNGIIPLIITSLLFGLAHMSNPEVQKFGWSIMLSYYIIFALFMGCITLLDEGLELAIGIHFANNMISGLLVSTPDSVLKPYSILETTNENPYLELICWFFMAGLTFLVFVKKYKWNNFNLLIK